MDFLDLYIRYRRARAWRKPGDRIAIRETLRNPKRIVVCLGGDDRLPPVVMPAVRLLRKHHSDAEVAVVTGPSNVAVFRRERIVDKAIVLNWKRGSGQIGEIQRVGKEIEQLNPEFLILLAPEPDPVLLALAEASGSSLRFGFGRGEHAPFLNFEVTPPSGEQYLAPSLLRMIGALTGRFHDFLDEEVRWRVPEPDAKRAERLIHFWQPRLENLLVAIEPGREKAGAEPDLDKYTAVARLLAREYKARIMIVAAPEDRPIAEELESRLETLNPYRAQIDDLAQAISFFSRADLGVSSNTPLFHYGVALGIPMIGLFPDGVDPCLMPPARSATAILPLHKELTEEHFIKAMDSLENGNGDEGS